MKNKDNRHNIFGLWSIQLAHQLELDLKKGERKVEVWADTIGVKIINIQYKKRDPFFNINTKEDLKNAYKLINNVQLQTISKYFKKIKINIGEETIKTQDCLNRVSATNIFCKENNHQIIMLHLMVMR